MAHKAVVQRVDHPQPERGLCEESVLLSQHIKLWIAVQYSSGNELIKNTNDERGQDSENHVVER